jgi:hypothetical protein
MSAACAWLRLLQGHCAPVADMRQADARWPPRGHSFERGGALVLHGMSSCLFSSLQSAGPCVASRNAYGQAHGEAAVTASAHAVLLACMVE